MATQARFPAALSAPCLAQSLLVAASALRLTPGGTSEPAGAAFGLAEHDAKCQAAPDGLGEACPRLGSWPRCCNGRERRRAYGCSRKPRVFYSARLAQQAADAEPGSARRGIDETEGSARAKLEAIRDGLRRGLSPEQTAASSAGGVRRVFPLVLNDNGSEFSDEDATAEAIGEREGETRLFCCDPRRADQKGACEKNHVEIRKVLPKGRGLRLDLLTRADCALLMSHVNSEPRGCLGSGTPYDAFAGVFGDDGRALLDALGVGRVPAPELDLTPGPVERARAERGDEPLA